MDSAGGRADDIAGSRLVSNPILYILLPEPPEDFLFWWLPRIKRHPGTTNDEHIESSTDHEHLSETYLGLSQDRHLRLRGRLRNALAGGKAVVEPGWISGLRSPTLWPSQMTPGRSASTPPHISDMWRQERRPGTCLHRMGALGIGALHARRDGTILPARAICLSFHPPTPGKRLDKGHIQRSAARGGRAHSLRRNHAHECGQLQP